MRKPQVGMIAKLSDKYNVDLSRSWMIGDKVSDDLYHPLLKTLQISSAIEINLSGSNPLLCLPPSISPDNFNINLFFAFMIMEVLFVSIKEILMSSELIERLLLL